MSSNERKFLNELRRRLCVHPEMSDDEVMSLVKGSSMEASVRLHFAWEDFISDLVETLPKWLKTRIQGP